MDDAYAAPDFGRRPTLALALAGALALAWLVAIVYVIAGWMLT